MAPDLLDFFASARSRGLSARRRSVLDSWSGWHGIRRLAALEAPRSSFEDGQAAIVRHTGQQIGTRQLSALTLAAAQDVDASYAQRARTAADGKDLLVLSCDAKGVVMRPKALREQTRTQAQNASGKLTTRLSS